MFHRIFVVLDNFGYAVWLGELVNQWSSLLIAQCGMCMLKGKLWVL